MLISCSFVKLDCLIVRLSELGDLPMRILGLLSTSVRNRICVELVESSCI